MKAFYLGIVIAGIIGFVSPSYASPALNCEGFIPHKHFPAQVTLLGNYPSGGQPILFHYGSTNPWNAGTDASGYLKTGENPDIGELHLYGHDGDIQIGTFQRNGSRMELEITQSIGIIALGNLSLECR